MAILENKDAAVDQAVAAFRRRLAVKLALRNAQASAAKVREIFAETGLGSVDGLEDRAERTCLVTKRARHGR